MALVGVVRHLLDIARRVNSVGGYPRPIHPPLGMISRVRPLGPSSDLGFLGGGSTR